MGRLEAGSKFPCLDGFVRIDVMGLLMRSFYKARFQTASTLGALTRIPGNSSGYGAAW